MMRNPSYWKLSRLAIVLFAGFCLSAAPALAEAGDDEPASEETLRALDASMDALADQMSLDIQTKIDDRTADMLMARTTAQLAAAREITAGRVARTQAPADAPRALSNCEYAGDLGFTCTVVASRLPEDETTPSLWDAMPAAPADD